MLRKYVEKIIVFHFILKEVVFAAAGDIKKTLLLLKIHLTVLVTIFTQYYIAQIWKKCNLKKIDQITQVDDTRSDDEMSDLESIDSDADTSLRPNSNVKKNNNKKAE